MKWSNRYTISIKSLRKIILFVLYLLIGMITASAIGFMIYISSLDVTKLGQSVPEPTLILDRYGHKQGQLTSSKIQPVGYEEIPDVLRNAIIAVEDKRFMHHNGVDLRATLRSFFRNLSAGSYAQGGSTITQQLAKNSFLSMDKTLNRKWKEWAYSLKLEQEYSKEQILTFYLNTIYYGDGQWGIRNAARHYFGKEVKDLNLEEAALIAALPKAPTRYSPFANPQLAEERRNLVLKLMEEQGLIQPEQRKAAAVQSVLSTKAAQAAAPNPFASYIDYVLEEAVSLYGLSESRLLAGGLRIYTELDPDVQTSMYNIYRNNNLFPASPEDQLLQSSAVILDHTSGGVRGLIGGRGEGVFRGFNRATQLKRQPGSTMKPLAVYSPALEHGFTPNDMIPDVELSFDGGYTPQNYDRRFRGAVSMDSALAMSLNVPAVWLLQQVGIQTAAQYVERSGIPLEPSDRHYALALGGMTHGVSPLQMAQAYAAYPNGGLRHQAHAITKIMTADGQVLAEFTKPPVRVTDENHAYTMTQMLVKAVAEGTGKNALLSRPTAGKSGTTQLPDTAEFQGLGSQTAKDAWFVGFTPELTAAVWLGYDRTDRDHYLNTTGGAVPAALFREMLTAVLAGAPVQAFARPAGYVPPALAWNPNGEVPEQDKQNDNEDRKKDDDDDDDDDDNKEEKKEEKRGKNKGKGKR